MAGTMGFFLIRLAFARLLRNRPPSLGPMALACLPVGRGRLQIPSVEDQIKKVPSGTFLIWRGRWDLNPRSLDRQSRALNQAKRRPRDI